MSEYPVTTISDEAFYECESLQSVILPESLQIIGNDAFFGCLLKDIACLAATPPSIEENSFNVETYATATFTVPQGTEAAYRAAKGWRLFYTTVLNAGIMYRVSEDGQTVAAIDADNYIVTANVLATVNIKGVDYLVTSIGDNYLVTSIGDNAFKDCTLLQSVTLPEGLQTIGDSSFYNCNALQSINIPQGVTEIKSRAFSNCSALQSINIPQGITTIGYSAFSNCSALQSINIPQGVMEIGLWTFNGCTSLQSVALPEGLQTIGYSAFSNCSALQSINIPQGVTEINLGAFLHCPLRDIICLATIPPTIELHSFDAETYETATLHVPSDAVADYQAAQYWEQFLHIESSLPPVSISSVAADASLARYANGILTTSAPAAITVYAQSGARVLHAADATSLSLEGLPRGIYIICVAQGRQRQVMKVVR